MLQDNSPLAASAPDVPLAGGIVIVAEPAKTITASQELALAEAIFARKNNRHNRGRLVQLLAREQEFGRVVDLLEGADDLIFREAALLVTSCLASEDDAGNRAACAAAERARAVAVNKAQEASALAMQGKALTRLGKVDEARAVFEQALVLDPGNKDACKRLAALDIEVGDFAAIDAMAERLQAQGAAHARLFAAQALASARTGDAARALAQCGLEGFPLELELTPPAPWSDLATFNDAVADELLAHMGLRLDHYGSASHKTMRVDNPSRPDTPAINALIDTLLGQLTGFIGSLDSASSPWAAARPERALLRSWSVITQGEGYESWHVHQFGWLSGVYYVRIPDSIARGNSTAGCLGFGLPPDLAGEKVAQEIGERIIRPEDGKLLVFPSHAYHRTYPHATNETRICFAFDLRPMA